MSWSTRRQFLYIVGIILFFLITVGGPIAYTILTIPPTCFDHIQNQTETAVDKGGPCSLLDERLLSPSSVLWARAFQVRDGTYSAVAYIQNPNEKGGVAKASYRMALYDAQNIPVAEKLGTTYIMPGTITPIFVSNINTGNRKVLHTYLAFTAPLAWTRMSSMVKKISINNIQITNTDTVPRISATAASTDVADIENIQFVATVFGTDGNAIAVSSTHIDRINSYESSELVFTWPDRFTVTVGKVDIIALHEPQTLKEKSN